MGPKSGPNFTFQGGNGGTGTYFAKYVGLPFGDPVYSGHYASGGSAIGGGIPAGWPQSARSKPGGGGSVFAGKGAPATGGGGGGAPGGTLEAGSLNTNTGTGGGGVIILSYVFP
jgi:hypothetical protein